VRHRGRDSDEKQRRREQRGDLGGEIEGNMDMNMNRKGKANMN
jgi:hypothetical protein